MNNGLQRSGGQTFADFMYAVVVGVAFSDIKISDPIRLLLPTFFLLVVVLEDFYLYQTQVKPHTDVFNFTSFSSLFFEVGILLAWFLSYLSRATEGRQAFICYAIFFFLKWFASVKHLSSAVAAGKASIVHRDHLFLVSTAGASCLSVLVQPSAIGPYSISLSDGWIVLAVLWLLQTVVWWQTVRVRSR